MWNPNRRWARAGGHPLVVIVRTGRGSLVACRNNTPESVRCAREIVETTGASQRVIVPGPVHRLVKLRRGAARWEPFDIRTLGEDDRVLATLALTADLPGAPDGITLPLVAISRILWNPAALQVLRWTSLEELQQGPDRWLVEFRIAPTPTEWRVTVEALGSLVWTRGRTASVTDVQLVATTSSEEGFIWRRPQSPDQIRWNVPLSVHSDRLARLVTRLLGEATGFRTPADTD